METVSQQQKCKPIKLALVNIADGAEPYGLIMLATYVKNKNKNIDIKIVNLNRKIGYIAETDTSIEEYIAELKKYEPDLIGLSAMTVFYEKAKKVAKTIKADPFFSNSKVIIGGVHISTLPTSMDPCFDVAIIGEAEVTLLELTNLFTNKNLTAENMQKIKSIAYFENGKLVKTEQRELIANLDELPLPSREYSFMNITFDEKCGNKTTMMTSRGCPYECPFCSTTQFWKVKIRYMSPQRVVDEIKMWHYDFDVKKISVWDDLFTLNKDRLNKISDLLEKEGILGKISFECMARTNLIDEEMIQILKKLNIVGMNFGFESGSPKMLSRLKEGITTIEHHKKAIELANKYGIKAGGSVVFGSPGETLQDMELTVKFIDWCLKHNVEHIWSFVMTPFPGTEVWEVAKQRGKVSDNMNFDWLSHQTYDNPLVLDPEINKEEFKKIFFKARGSLRGFILRVWFERFKEHPIKATTSVLSGFRFLKFFTKEFN